MVLYGMDIIYILSTAIFLSIIYGKFIHLIGPYVYIKGHKISLWPVLYAPVGIFTWVTLITILDIITWQQWQFLFVAFLIPYPVMVYYSHKKKPLNPLKDVEAASNHLSNIVKSLEIGLYKWISHH